MNKRQRYIRQRKVASDKTARETFMEPLATLKPHDKIRDGDGSLKGAFGHVPASSSRQVYNK